MPFEPRALPANTQPVSVSAQRMMPEPEPTAFLNSSRTVEMSMSGLPRPRFLELCKGGVAHLCREMRRQTGNEGAALYRDKVAALTQIHARERAGRRRDGDAQLAAAFRKKSAADDAQVDVEAKMTFQEMQEDVLRVIYLWRLEGVGSSL